MPAGECRTLGGREEGLVHRVRASSPERQVLVGARGMGVGDERKLHHGEDEAEDEDEEQHNDAAGLPAANGRPNIVGRTDTQTDANCH